MTYFSWKCFYCLLILFYLLLEGILMLPVCWYKIYIFTLCIQCIRRLLRIGLYNSELPIKNRNIYRLMDKTCAVQNDPGQCMIILITKVDKKSAGIRYCLVKNAKVLRLLNLLDLSVQSFYGGMCPSFCHL